MSTKHYVVRLTRTEAEYAADILMAHEEALGAGKGGVRLARRIALRLRRAMPPDGSLPVWTRRHQAGR